MLLAAPFLATLSAGPAADHAKGSTGAWIANIAVSRSACNVKVAAKVTFTELVGNPAGWSGKCISVDGYWQGRRLFLSAAAAEAGSTQGLESQLGLYGSDKRLAKAPKRALPYTAVGRVGDCKDLWQAAEMVLGYCHYYARGPYLALGQMRRR